MSRAPQRGEIALPIFALLWCGQSRKRGWTAPIPGGTGSHSVLLGVLDLCSHAVSDLGDWGGGKVKPGALYQFVVVATDQFGNASKPRAAGFSLDGKQNASGF